MKTLKNIAAAVLVALSFSVSAFAADGSASKKWTVNDAVSTYIGAVTDGKLSSIAEVLDNNVKFTSARGSQVVNHNKAQVLQLLKAGADVKQNCSTEVEIVGATPSQQIVKLTMKYKGFSKIEYLNLSNTENGWKITSVSTSFI